MELKLIKLQFPAMVSLELLYIIYIELILYLETKLYCLVQQQQHTATILLNLGTLIITLLKPVIAMDVVTIVIIILGIDRHLDIFLL